MTDKIRAFAGKAVVLTTFCAILFYFAVHLKTRVSPDEESHLNFALNSVQTINQIGEQDPAIFPIGYSHFYATGYGYHLVLHSLAWIIEASLGAELERDQFRLLFRFLSILLTFLNLWIIKKSCDVLELKGVFTWVVVWLSAALMFPFLHASVTRDVAVNLFASCMVYNVLAYQRFGSIRNIMWLMMLLAFAPMLQISLGAFSLALILSLAISDLSNLKKMLLDVADILRFKTSKWFPVLFILCASPAAIDLSNKVYHFGTVYPHCTDIFDIDTCNRRHALTRAYGALEAVNKNKKRMPHHEYVLVWFDRVFDKTFGISGHRHYYHPQALFVVLTGGLWSFFLIGLFQAYRGRKKSLLLLGVLSILYLATVYWINRKAYVRIARIGPGLHGRYFFPALPSMLVVANSWTSQLWTKRPLVYWLMLLVIWLLCLYGFALFINDPDTVHIVHKRALLF